MRTLFFLTILLVTLSSQAKTVLRCQDSSGTFYQVTREDHSSQAILQEMDGGKVIASRDGKLQAAGQIDSYFVSLYDQNGIFFLVGTDLNSLGWALTGAVDAL